MGPVGQLLSVWDITKTSLGRVAARGRYGLFYEGKASTPWGAQFSAPPATMMPWLILTLLGLTAADRPSERGLYWEYEPFATDASGRARAALNVTEMHVVFSNHLDAGFNVRAWCDGADGCTSTNNSKSGLSCRPWTYWVVQENIDTFLPRAIATAKGLRSSDTPFSYLTNSWLVAFLLDCEKSGLADWRPPAIGAPLLRCPNASAIAEFKAAVSRRDVHFHAFPFSSNPGLYDTSLFNATLRMALDQAATLGVRAPTTFSQRDETGMTRSIVPLLAASGVGMISLGSGGSSGGHPVIPEYVSWSRSADHWLPTAHCACRPCLPAHPTVGGSNPTSAASSSGGMRPPPPRCSSCTTTATAAACTYCQMASRSTARGTRIMAGR